MKRIICFFLLGHKWMYLEASFVGEFEGKFCKRCNKERGFYTSFSNHTR